MTIDQLMESVQTHVEDVDVVQEESYGCMWNSYTPVSVHFICK